MIRTTKNPLTGYMLLPRFPLKKYRGIDRIPFQPTLPDGGIMESTCGEESSTSVWTFWPAGWKRDAYRLYEENLATGTEETVQFLSSRAVADQIRRIIEPHIGSHEIVHCKLWDLDLLPSYEDEEQSRCSGYDIAYPGGDFYSAVRNGLLENPHPDLVSEYRALLNEAGLFPSTQPIPGYVIRFRELVASEVSSEFAVFRLTIEV